MSEFAGFKNRYMLIYICFFLNIKALAGLSKLQIFFLRAPQPTNRKRSYEFIDF